MLVVVVPDYLKERTFFWDVDYTHNFITTERRVRQLLYDSGFTVLQVVRSIGAATGLRRDVLAGASLIANVPGLDASRGTSARTSCSSRFARTSSKLSRSPLARTRNLHPGAQRRTAYTRT